MHQDVANNVRDARDAYEADYGGCGNPLVHSCRTPLFAQKWWWRQRPPWRHVPRMPKPASPRCDEGIDGVGGFRPSGPPLHHNRGASLPVVAVSASVGERWPWLAQVPSPNQRCCRGTEPVYALVGYLGGSDGILAPVSTHHSGEQKIERTVGNKLPYPDVPPASLMTMLADFFPLRFGHCVVL